MSILLLLHFKHIKSTWPISTNFLLGKEWLLFYTELIGDTDHNAEEAIDNPDSGTEHADEQLGDSLGDMNGGQANPAYQYEVFGSTFTDFVGPNAKPKDQVLEDIRQQDAAPHLDQFVLMHLFQSTSYKYTLYLLLFII